MAATKECPSCGTEVPEIAPRCKVCFHDFAEKPPASGNGLLLLLAAFTAMAVIAAAITGYVAMQPTGMLAHVDHDSRSIVFVTQYRNGEETETIAWSDVGRVEHITTSQGEFLVNAKLLDGSTRLLAQGEVPLGAEAERFAEVMDKPVEYMDETQAFQTAAQEAQ